MPRIVYVVLGTGTPRGGHKMALRHVETLRGLGFDAVAWIQAEAPLPSWLGHGAPIQHGGGFQADDVLVLPEDAPTGLRFFGSLPQSKVVFCQNHFSAAAAGLGPLLVEEGLRFADYIACSQTVAGWLARFMPHESIEVVPAFADERLFRPATKVLSVACAPSKRQSEFRAIQFMLRRLGQGGAGWRWCVIQDKSEAEVVAIMGEASLYLSLSRFEGLGMTTLEAMASGCIPVGFTGLGGREYATPVNGVWIEEDDVVACAEALARTMALVEAEHPAVLQMRAAAEETAGRYSHAVFATALDTFWSRRVSRAG
jgi:glycosyltransferase involved in cell wall biosynthesis